MDLENIRENRRKVILQFSIPAIISMVLTSMINVIDGFFIGNYVGSQGLAAVNLGLPIVYLYLAIGLLISVGGVSIAGRLLGKGSIKESNNIFRQTMLTTVIVSVVLTVIMFFALNPISSIFSANAKTVKYFQEYYRIMMFEFPFMVIVSSFGMFIRGEGNPVFVMKTNILSVVLDIVLDYLFVGPLGLGVAGIAWASLVAIVIVFGLNIFYFVKEAKVFKLGRFEFSGSVLKGTIFNGSSEFIGEMAMCISMSAYNYVILKYIGVDGVSAFTIVGFVSYVYSMIIVGFGQGIVPLVSFSYGADDKNLAVKIRKTTNKMVMCSAVAFFVIMSMLSGVYCKAFVSDKSIINMVRPGLLIQMSSFVFAGINTITSFYFTSIGKAKESAIISSARGLIVLLICIFTLPMLFGITGVWLVGIVTETITVLISLMFCYSTSNVKKRNNLHKIVDSQQSM